VTKGLKRCERFDFIHRIGIGNNYLLDLVIAFEGLQLGYTGVDNPHVLWAFGSGDETARGLRRDGIFVRIYSFGTPPGGAFPLVFPHVLQKPALMVPRLCIKPL
jgi:hypothetical protein